MTTDIDEFIAHFGVKGMRWGVRKRTMTEEGKSKRPPKKTQSEDAAKAATSLAKSKKQGLASLSNAELKALNERMQLESSYKQLNERQKTKGRQMAESIIINSGQELAKEAFKSGIKTAFNPKKRGGAIEFLAKAYRTGASNLV